MHTAQNSQGRWEPGQALGENLFLGHPPLPLWLLLMGGGEHKLRGHNTQRASAGPLLHLPDPVAHWPPASPPPILSSPSVGGEVLSKQPVLLRSPSLVGCRAGSGNRWVSLPTHPPPTLGSPSPLWTTGPSTNYPHPTPTFWWPCWFLFKYI